MTPPIFLHLVRVPAALFVAGFAMFALTAPLAAQQTYTWDAGVGGTSGDWGNRTNWVDDPSPLTFTNTTDIIFSQPAMTTNTVFTFLGAANRTIRSLTFGADLAGNTNLFDVRLLATSSSTSAARDLIFSAASGNASITVAQSTSGVSQIRLGNNSGGNIVLSSTLDLAQNNTFFTNAAAFQLGNSVTGAGTINKTGAGVVTVVRNNSGWSGGMNINEGEVQVFSDANAMGTGAWTLGGGTNNTVLTVGSTLTHNSGGLVVGAGGGTRTIANYASSVGNPTLGGAITLNKDVIFNIANITNGHNSITVSGAIGGTGGIVKTGTGILILSASNNYTGGTTISAGTLQFTNGGSVAGNITNNATLSINRTDSSTLGNTVSGIGALTKSGAGTAILGASNNFTGATVVTGGVLNLNSSAGAALGSTASVSVTNATLLISQSDQVSNTAAVTLSGGTIAKGAGVINETMGALTLSSTSFLDFGTGTGNFTFSTFTPGAFQLTLQNFNVGNSLTVTTGTFAPGAFNFSSFDYSWDEVPSGGFTITAIPEPSTYLAAAGLLALLLAARKRSPRVPGAESCSNS
jgi:autotransporter-associated beta strand protein